MVGDIRCPVIGFFGNLDKNPSPEQVDRIDAELTRHGIVHNFHRYDNAGHGFQNRLPGTAGEQAAAADAWAKTFAFLALPSAAEADQFSATAALPASRPNTALRVWPVNDG